MSDTKRVWLFEEGNATMRDELGGKGANLCEMSNIGLPVPPGFTVTTEVCNDYYAGRAGTFPAGLMDEIKTAHRRRSKPIRPARKLGDADQPAAACRFARARKFSMPGMMDTVLNLGLNDATVEVADQASTGNERFVYDSYRRFLMMLSDVAYSDGTNHLAKHDFEHIFYAMKKDLGVTDDLQVDGATAQAALRDLQGAHQGEQRPRVPAGPDRPAPGLGLGRLEVLEQRPRHPVSPAREDQRRPRHGRQHPGHGLRQPGRGLRNRRRLHPQRRPTATRRSSAST